MHSVLLDGRAARHVRGDIYEVRARTADRMRVVLHITTALWQQREALGMTVDQVAERSGLSLDEVEAVEDNDVDSPFQGLARYAEAVGLQFQLTSLRRGPVVAEVVDSHGHAVLPER